MTTWLDQSATSMARAIRDGSISSGDFVAAHIDRLEAVNPALSAVVQLPADEAANEAVAADETPQGSEPVGPLHGVPLTVRYSISTAGVVTIGPIAGREGFVPRGAQAVSDIHSRTFNPHDPNRSVAASGGSPLGLGSDPGGSIRFPAHFCGIAGLCPTFGRVPHTGHAPFYFSSATTGVIGPLSRYVEELVLTLPVLSEEVMEISGCTVSGEQPN